MMSGLNGKVALITGAARGIGRAIAMEMACRGAAVAVNYRSSKVEAEDLAERIKGMGASALLVPGDVAKPVEARRVVERVIEEWKRLDILVNNAGITRDRSMRKLEDDEWADVINVNLNGTFYCTSAAIPTMVEQKFGRIVNISSFVGQAGNFGQANYAASKGGIIAFTKTLAIEMAKFNITANAVAPGFTATDMLTQVPANIQDQLKSKIPLGRFGTPEEVAKTVAFLASEGDYITGQQINVNGGIYM
jgi:acetoacetyl-CoA reductase/3-oxoacyl-[acyl-carrier protein] reductase